MVRSFFFACTVLCQLATWWIPSPVLPLGVPCLRTILNEAVDGLRMVNDPVLYSLPYELPVPHT